MSATQSDPATPESVASKSVTPESVTPDPWPPTPRSADTSGWSPRTLAVSAGRPKGPGSPLNQPIVLASNFREGGEYVRTHGTESWIAFEEAIGALEGGYALSFASGMAAASAILQAVVPKIMVLPNASYMGVRTLINDLAAAHGIEVRLVDVTDTEAVLAAAVGADLVWLESPTNPTLDLADLATLCASLTERSIPSVVDSTFATPLGQQPLQLGATVVLHSATKFIGGHSDLILGVAITSDPKIYDALFHARTYGGATPGALETFLALRGLRTLPLRYHASTVSAVELAKRLGNDDRVLSVRQIGPMMAVILRGGAPLADRVCATVRLMVPATSLGGVETTIERRQKYAGDAQVNPGLLRISVGIEDVEDLWDDLMQAMAG
jgi:cystathionine gamma-synthase